MSNFKCEKCGVNITEKEDGTYGTFCDHYPEESFRPYRNKTEKEIDQKIFNNCKTGNYAGRATAVKSVDLTNPYEWNLEQKANDRSNT